MDSLISDVIVTLIVTILAMLLVPPLVGASGKAHARLGSIWPEVITVEVHEPPGSVFPSPRLRIVAFSIFFSVALLPLNTLYPPFHTWSPLSFLIPTPVRSGGAGEILSEAEWALRDALEESNELVRRAQADASFLNRDAVDEAQELRERGQVQAAETVEEMAQAEARRLLEAAHEVARLLRESGQARADRLYETADSLLSVEAAQSLLPERRFRGLFVWPVRLLVLVGFLGMLYRDVPVKSLGPAAAGTLTIGLGLGVVDIFANAYVFDLLMPPVVAAMVYAAWRVDLTGAQSVYSGLYVIYQRFGHVMGFVAGQLLLVIMAVILGASIGAGVWWIEWRIGEAVVSDPGYPLYSAEDYAVIGGWVTPVLALEVGRALVVLSFFSVLKGGKPRG